MADRSRPTIKPWLPRLWRDTQTLQIGLDPASGVRVSGLDTATAGWLVGIDGSRSEAEILAEAAAVGLDLACAVGILTGLRRSGVLLPAPLDAGSADEVGQVDDTGRLVPELISLTESLSSPRRGAHSLLIRGRRHVLIDGANRIGVPLGALLAASGVGRLSFTDAEFVRRCDSGVGGLSIADEGEPRVAAARRAIRRVTHRGDEQPEPTIEPATEEAARDADLVVLCQPWTAHDPLQSSWVADRTAHLTVAVREGTVVIGPLVLPGLTSCLHCAELHRTDRDSRWPAIAAQLVAGANRAMHEPTSVLASLAAAFTAGQVLDHLDGHRSPEVIEATLELHPPDWQLHRRPWPPHPDCDCLRESAPAGGSAPREPPPAGGSAPREPPIPAKTVHPR